MDKMQYLQYLVSRQQYKYDNTANTRIKQIAKSNIKRLQKAIDKLQLKV